MGLQHRQIQYMYFHPSLEQKDQIDKEIDKISEFMPADTTAHSVFKYGKGHIFEGNLRFNSKIGDFIAQGKANNLLQLIRKLRSKILQQWRHKKTVMLSR